MLCVAMAARFPGVEGTVEEDPYGARCMVEDVLAVASMLQFGFCGRKG